MFTKHREVGQPQIVQMMPMKRKSPDSSSSPAGKREKGLCLNLFACRHLQYALDPSVSLTRLFVDDFEEETEDASQGKIQGEMAEVQKASTKLIMQRARVQEAVRHAVKQRRTRRQLVRAVVGVYCLLEPKFVMRGRWRGRWRGRKPAKSKR